MIPKGSATSLKNGMRRWMLVEMSKGNRASYQAAIVSVKVPPGGTESAIAR